MEWKATAPSNLALIKYIGKQDNQACKSNVDNLKDKHTGNPKDKRIGNFNINKSNNKPSVDNSNSNFDNKSKDKSFFKNIPKSSFKENIPLNASLSFTLNHLQTKIKIEEAQKDELDFKPLNHEPSLSPEAKAKFLNFFNFLKNAFGVSGFYKITSENNFPHSAGVASSSSSFAALTQATYNLAKDRSSSFYPLDTHKLARLSSWGSGSSSRSFFSPWALWEVEGVKEFKQNSWFKLSHDLIIVPSQNKNVKFQTKKITSSKAHQLIRTSKNFKGRPERAEARLKDLIKSFDNEDWEASYRIVKDEFLDMHNLFSSSSPSFSYQTAESQNILTRLFNFWSENKDGPLITMDAGPHIHLLYRLDQKELACTIREMFKDCLFISSGF